MLSTDVRSAPTDRMPTELSLKAQGVNSVRNPAQLMLFSRSARLLQEFEEVVSDFCGIGLTAEGDYSEVFVAGFNFAVAGQG